jgi:hypothetical protein
MKEILPRKIWRQDAIFLFSNGQIARYEKREKKFLSQVESVRFSTRLSFLCFRDQNMLHLDFFIPVGFHSFAYISSSAGYLRQPFFKKV